MSNFWFCEVSYHGIRCRSVEHGYQLAKTLDPIDQKWIANQLTAADAKRAGKKVTLRYDWEQVKVEIMTDLVRQKFTNDDELKFKLLLTGTRPLIEGNTWGDTYWGVCKGVGKNMLGKILELIREELRTSDVVE